MSSILTLNGDVLIASGNAILGEIATGTIQSNKNYTVSASGSQTIIPDTGYNSMQQVSLTIPVGTATAPSTISGNSATVSTDTNTLILTKTISVTPSITTNGWITAGTAGNSTVSLTAAVTTKGATTYTPSTSAQTIPAGTYLTGTQTIAAIARADGVSF